LYLKAQLVLSAQHSSHRMMDLVPPGSLIQPNKLLLLGLIFWSCTFLLRELRSFLLLPYLFFSRYSIRLVPSSNPGQPICKIEKSNLSFEFLLSSFPKFLDLGNASCTRTEVLRPQLHQDQQAKSPVIVCSLLQQANGSPAIQRLSRRRRRPNRRRVQF
jgi:hypothetical protein